MDDILAQYNAFTKTLNLHVTNTKHKEMMAMKYPYPGAVTVKGDLLSEDVSIKRLDFEISIRNLIMDVGQVFSRILYLDRSIRITEENKILLNQAQEVARTKYKTGIGTYTNLIKVQVELSKLEDRLITLKSQKDTTRAKINMLLNRDPDAPFANGVSTVTDGDTLFSYTVRLPSKKTLSKTAVLNKQEVRRVSHEIRRMALMIEMVRSMSHPDFSIGSSYFEDRNAIRVGTDKDKGTFMPGGMNKTQFWFGREDSYLEELRLKRAGLINQMKDTVNRAVYGLEENWFSLDEAIREYGLFKDTLLPQAEQALTAVQKVYAAGELDFLNYLDAQRTWLDFSLAIERAAHQKRTHYLGFFKSMGRKP